MILDVTEMVTPAHLVAEAAHGLIAKHFRTEYRDAEVRALCSQLGALSEQARIAVEIVGLDVHYESLTDGHAIMCRGWRSGKEYAARVPIPYTLVPKEVPR